MTSLKTIGLLITHQFRQWHRSHLLVIFLSTSTLLWTGCLFTGLAWHQSVSQIRENARQQSRQQWLNQDAKHPHIAAHFGNFAFKPIQALSIFDNGIDLYSGTYIYLEAHRQNDFLFTPAQSSSAFTRFGEFNVALLLQVLFPLFLIILTFNSVLSEKTAGTLAFLKSNGASGSQIVWSKILAPWLLVSGLVAGLYLVSIGIIVAKGIAFPTQDWVKSISIYLGYAGYYFILISLGIWVSAYSKTVKQSLVVLLSAWVFACILMPKLLSNVASASYPLPSNTTFKDAVRKDILQGIDGHNSSDARAQQLTQSLLKKYGVDSTQKLPVNIEGVVMMEGEKYSSRVYNQHFNRLTDLLLQQHRLFSFAAILNPLLGIKHVSMGLSNTDIFNEIAFRKEAEAYRMNFVQAMNQDMALHSKENEFETYKVNQKMYGQIGDFAFRPITAGQSLINYLPELACLLTLLIASVVLVQITGRRV